MFAPDKVRIIQTPSSRNNTDSLILPSTIRGLTIVSTALINFSILDAGYSILKTKYIQALDTLESGRYYHIYNRGINGCDLFTEEDNYTCFLSLYEKYIDPVADTFS